MAVTEKRLRRGLQLFGRKGAPMLGDTTAMSARPMDQAARDAIPKVNLAYGAVVKLLFGDPFHAKELAGARIQRLAGIGQLDGPSAAVDEEGELLHAITASARVEARRDVRPREITGWIMAPMRPACVARTNAVPLRGVMIQRPSSCRPVSANSSIFRSKSSTPSTSELFRRPKGRRKAAHTMPKAASVNQPMRPALRSRFPRPATTYG